MTLKSLKPFTRDVETPAGKITVRGLSLEDMTLIFNRHRAEVAAFAATVKVAEGMSEELLANLAGRLLTELPQVTAEIIAVADGEFDEESIAIARSLPAPVQIELIDAIGGLTFHTEEQLKKAVETVIKLVRGATNAVANLRA